MKKFISIVLCLILVVCFSACSKGNDNPAASSATAKTEQSSSEASTSSEEYQIETSSKASSTQSQKPSISSKPSSTAPSTNSSKVESQKPSQKPNQSSSEKEIPKAPDYSGISCRSVGGFDWKAVKIKNMQKTLAFDFKIPSDWELSPNGDKTYNIIRSGKVIGTVSTTEPQKPNEDFEYSSETDLDAMITKTRQIDWCYQDGTGSFYKTFTFYDYPQTVYYKLYFRINYSELDKASADYFYNSAASASTIGDAPIPPLPQNSSSKEILILGNSFIGSSHIGLILNDMLDEAKSEYNVKTVSIGGAYTGTFFENKTLMNEIKSGKYCYVFQCGLYSSKAVSTFAPLKEVYDEAGVPVVFFPAHNENAASIDSALQQYYDVPILNWKGELDALIKSGISRDILCQNDYYGHSKPIAGYVGAHMIFRTLFGKMPTDNTSSVGKDEVRSVLGSYADTGVVPGTTPTKVFVGTVYDIK